MHRPGRDGDRARTPPACSRWRGYAAANDAATSACARRPLHQHVGLALLVAAAIGPLDFAKAARLVEADGCSVALEHPEPQRCAALHRDREQRLAHSSAVAFRTDVEMIDP